MIVGVVTVVSLLVIRLQTRPLPLPETITLPKGVQAIAITASQDWYAVVTENNKILIYDRLTGSLRQTLTIE